jgi:hypothetical protein
MRRLCLLVALYWVLVAGRTAHGAEAPGGKAGVEPDPTDQLMALIECRTPLADLKTVQQQLFAHIMRTDVSGSRWTRSEVVGPGAGLIENPTGIHAHGRQGQRLLIVADNTPTEPHASLQRTMRSPGPGLTVDSGYSTMIRASSGIFMEVDEAPAPLAEAWGLPPLDNEANRLWYRRRMTEERETNTLGDRAIVWVNRAVGHVFQLPERPNKTYIGCEYRFDGWILDTAQP